MVGVRVATQPDLSCASALGAPTITKGPLKTYGREPTVTQLPVLPGREYLVQVEERNNDALLEILGSKGQLIARVDHPERRTGTRRAVVTVPDSSMLFVRVLGKEHAGATGTATVGLFDLTNLRERPDCLGDPGKRWPRQILAYAAAKEVSSDRERCPPSGAREAFMHAAQAYSRPPSTRSVCREICRYAARQSSPWQASSTLICRTGLRRGPGRSRPAGCSRPRIPTEERVLMRFLRQRGLRLAPRPRQGERPRVKAQMGGNFWSAPGNCFSRWLNFTCSGASAMTRGYS